MAKKECPICLGDGNIYELYNEEVYSKDECYTCKGTGYFEGDGKGNYILSEKDLDRLMESSEGFGEELVDIYTAKESDPNYFIGEEAKRKEKREEKKKEIKAKEKELKKLEKEYEDLK